MPGRKRSCALAVAAFTLLSSAQLASVASGAVDPLAQAQAEITAAQAAADHAASEFDAAQARYYRHQADAAHTQTQIAALQRSRENLAAIVRDRAVQTYMRGDAGGLNLLDLNSADLLDSSRRAIYVEHATANDRSALDEYRAITDDLRNRERTLTITLAAERDDLAKLRAQQVQLTNDVAGATHAAQQLRAELARQRRASEYAARLRRALEAARASASSTRTTASTPTGGGTSGQIIASGDWVCPVQGPVSFTDTFGAPRSGGRRHQGNDLFASRGTPLVAVVSGSVWFQGDPLGGNAAYVDGNDGRTYYYAHLQDEVGGNRPVKAGEAIGHLGNTGDAVDAPPQLHFEIRLGNANGPRIDPYPTLRAHC